MDAFGKAKEGQEADQTCGDKRDTLKHLDFYKPPHSSRRFGSLGGNPPY
jgi:hypothetical protein